jgi:16S rRNA (guanine966-N2)-methyltransferase
LRIIAGELKGREITLPKRSRARPITSVVLEQVMNLFDAFGCELGTRLPNGCFLDICAGSGLVGFEALSRGARRTLFVETDAEHAQALRDTAQRFGVRQRCAVLKLDARHCIPAVAKALSEDEQLSAVFLDPPFIPKMAADILSHVARGLAAAPRQLLLPEALVIIRATDEVPGDLPALRLLDKRDSGRAKLWLFGPL